MRHLTLLFCSLALAACQFGSGVTKYGCGERVVSISAIDKTATLRSWRGALVLPQAPSASGVKYMKPDADENSPVFWMKGNEATLVIGKKTIACKPTT